MGLLRWVKSKLRDWLLYDDNDMRLELHTGETVTAHGTAGVALVVDYSNQSSAVVQPHQAKDKQRYIKLWKRLGGCTPVWETDQAPYLWP